MKMNNLYYYSESDGEIYHSFERYIRFIFSKTIISTDLTDIFTDGNILLFLLKDGKENIRLLNKVVDSINIKTVLIGFDNSCKINLIKLNELEIKLNQILTHHDFNDLPLLKKAELHKKINIFFKDHGKESLLDKLNWVRYYFLNGPKLFFQNELSEEDYKSKFYDTGLNYWIKFKERLERYSIYIKMLGKEKEIEIVKELILTIDSEIEKLNVSNCVKRDYRPEKIEKLVGKLERINEILLRIYSDINIGNEKI